jgi:AraC-like DNA-binding protein
MENEVEQVIFTKTFYDTHDQALGSRPAFENMNPFPTPCYMIFQAGEYYYAKLISIGPHKQLFDLELTICLTENLKCFTNHVGTSCGKYDIYVNYRDEIHEITSSGIFRYQFLAINFKPESHTAFLYKKLKENYTTGGLVMKNKAASQFMDEILACFRLPENEYTSVLLDSKITELLCVLLDNNTVTSQAENKNSVDLIPRICNYIDTNFIKIFSLTVLSVHFGYAYEYLSVLFKKNMKISMREYLTSKKMEYARVLLYEQKKTVSEVTELLLYASPNNFTRAYRKYFGHSPSTDKNLSR